MSEPDGEGRAAREAAEWLARLNSRSVSTEELNAFYAWRRDPENAAAYARGETIWHEARGLGDDRDIAEAVKQALERPRLGRAEGKRVSRRTLIGSAGALAAAAGAGWLMIGRSEHYRTARGEQLAVRLADGSRLRLNTDSEVAVRLGDARREVRLLRGQALFEVARDPSRPFVVTAGPVAVRALGTRFDIRALAGEATQVLLVEGRIEIVPQRGGWRQTLAAPGTALVLGAAGPQLSRLDVEATTSWTTGRLIFRHTPLEEAVAEVNRYSATQISLEAPALRRLEVDGTFEAGDAAAFVSALTMLFPLRAQPQSEGGVLLTPA